MRDFASDTPANLTRKWVARIAQNNNRIKASDLYCGRSFSEALLATTTLNARLLVASAGLGLIDALSKIPSYSATFTPGTDDYAINKLRNGHALDWWRSLNLVSPYAVPLDTTNYDFVMVAMSSPYFGLIIEQLAELPSSERHKLRLFLRLKKTELPHSLSNYLMPYDARLDQAKGPNPGTMNDFPQRALRHFAEKIFPQALNGTAMLHQEIVSASLVGLTPPSRIPGRKVSNEEILRLIEQYWNTEATSAAKTVRLFRDKLGVACERKRLHTLFTQVSSSKASQVKK